MYAKLLGLGQLSGYPLKVWGIRVQISYWKGLWHQNCGYTSPILFFGGGKRNQWKTELFCKSLRTRKFSTRKFFGVSTQEILTHSGFRKCIWKVGTTYFWPCFGRPKLGECDKMGSVSKIISRWKKQIRPQFSKYRLQIESAWAHRLWAHADSIWKQYFENCGRIYFFQRLILVVFFCWK